MKKFLLATVLMLLCTLAFSQERIAVFPFEDLDNLLTKNEAVFFYRQFSNEFTNKNAGRFTIVPRQDVEKLFNAEEKFQLSDLSAKAKTVETQKVLNGTQILSGVIGKVNNRITISVSLYTFPEISQLPGGVDLRVANKDELFDKIPELVQSMLSAIGGKNSAKVFFDRGMLFKNRKDLDTAILDFNEAIRLDPDYTLAYYCRGEVYRDKGDNNAITDYTKVIQLEPNYKWAYFNRGFVYSRKSDYDLAIADYTQFIRLDPNEMGAYLNRGLVYFDKKDYDHAILDYNIIIRLDPNDVGAYSNRGLAYYYKKDYDKAIADYNQILKLNSYMAETTYFVRGNAYYAKGDYNQALADYNKSIQLDPDYAEPYNGRGNVYFNMGKYDQAILDYEAALRIRPNHPTAKINLENALKKRDNKQ